MIPASPMSVASTPREKWSLHWGCSSRYGESFNMVMDPSMACTLSPATLGGTLIHRKAPPTQRAAL